MPVEVEVNEEGLVVHPVTSRKKKLLIFKEAQLLKGLTAKKAHADEVVNNYYHREFENNE